MTLREAVERGDRDAVADKIFPWIVGVCMVLAVAWVTFAFFDFGAAIGALFIAAGVIAVLLIALFIAVGIVDAVADMLT